MLNTSISLTELILSTAFEFGQTTLSSISDIAELSVLTLDSILGCTETSRAICEIVKLIREEYKDCSEHDGEVDLKDIVAGLTCFVILQYRTHARVHSETSTPGRLVWDVVVEAEPAEAPSSAPDNDEINFHEDGMVTVRSTGEEDLLPPILLDKLPSKAELSISSTSTTTSTTTIEVIGTAPPEFSLPPGAVVLNETWNHDELERYRIVYETVKRSEQSKRLKREDNRDTTVIEENEKKQGDERRVFEIEEPKIEGRLEIEAPIMPKVQKAQSRTDEPKEKAISSKGKDKGKISQQLPSGSESDRTTPSPLVPKKAKASQFSGRNSGFSHPTEANKPRKRSSTAPNSSSPSDKKQGKDKNVKSTFRRALSASVVHVKDKKMPNVVTSILTKPSSPITTTRSSPTAIIPQTQSQPKPLRSRRPSIASRPASPELLYAQRSSHSIYHSRQHHHSPKASSHEGYTCASLHCGCSRDVPVSRPSSAISIYSYEGDSPPQTHHLSRKHSLSYVPSVYSLHTSHSTASLHLLYSPPTAENPGPYYPSNFHLLHNLRRYVRFAAASYGAKFMKLLLNSQFSPMQVAERAHHPEHQAFSFHTSLPVDTILLSSHFDPSGGFDSAGHTGTGRPLVHFVCVDHEASAIVVTCRGTLGLEDVLTDLTCEYTTICLRGRSYRVHKGMYNSARLLLRRRLLSSLAVALQSFPNYGLVLTGHSLGGGVAALVSILISTPTSESGTFVTSHEGLPADRRVHCYAFGSPAIVCGPLRVATRGLITTVVNGNDVVPSLSIGVIRDFHSVALSFREDTSGVLGEVRRRFLAGLWNSSTGSANSEDEWNWEIAVLKTLRAGMTAEKLVPPGEVWCVSREYAYVDAEKVRGTRKEGMAASSNPPAESSTTTPLLQREKVRLKASVVEDVEKRFGEVRFLKKCFGDHSPAAYEKTLEALKRGVVVC
jgi:hypothetical protein